MLQRLVAREIDYLWSRLARASRHLENLAPMWSRGGDPRVVRLVESAAYVCARIREKVEDDVPEVAHPIVASALPGVLRPVPSTTIVHVADAPARRRDVATRDTIRLASRPIDERPCVFQTAWPIRLAPVTLDRAALRMPEPGVQRLTLRLSVHGGAAFAHAFPEALRVFVDDPNVFRALDLVHALCTARDGIEVRVFGARSAPLGVLTVPPTTIRWTALHRPFRLFPGRDDRFASGAALRAFHATPEVFAFFDVVGLHQTVGRAFPSAESVELTVALGSLVESGDVRCVLDCAPATNVFATDAALRVRGLGRLGLLRSESYPGAEVFEIQRARLEPSRDRSAETEVLLWESDLGELWGDDLYLQLERRAAVGRGPTETWLSLLRPEGKGGVPAGDLRVDFLASDGFRTETLLRGDVGLRSDILPVTNITRVTRPFAPRLDDHLPWRLNAYARMPVTDLATAPALGTYVALHDPRDDDGREPAATSGILSVARRSSHRVVRDEVVHGDDVDIELDEGAWGGRGAAWLVGEIAARALAERTDLLRYTRTRWVHRGHALADYGRRTGERLPFPIG